MSENLNPHVARGKDGQTVAAQLHFLLQAASKPDIIWCEPTPRKERLKDFACLWVKDFAKLLPHLDAQAGVALDEARLFWSDGWLHLLASQTETRWAAFRENAAPAWLTPDPSQQATWEVRREEENVVLLKDLHRYGLVGLAFPKNDCKVQLYSQDSRLVGWKLTTVLAALPAGEGDFDPSR
jgi:hypothetical protein